MIRHQQETGPLLTIVGKCVQDPIDDVSEWLVLSFATIYTKLTIHIFLNRLVRASALRRVDFFAEASQRAQHEFFARLGADSLTGWYSFAQMQQLISRLGHICRANQTRRRTWNVCQAKLGIPARACSNKIIGKLEANNTQL